MPRLRRTFGIKSNPPPRAEGAVTLADGRQIGYAEYGEPRGPLVMWFHGTPGARRQLPPIAHDAARALGLRIVCAERPGVGDSTEHVYEHLSDWAADAVAVAERLGHEHFMVVGLSGGGPYALACAHEFPDRVVGVGLLGSVTPVTGDEVATGGPVSLAVPFNGLISAIRRPLGLGLWAFVQVVTPFAHALVLAATAMMPEGDRAVVLDPDYEAMFVDDLVLGAKRQFQAIVNDVILFGRPWGFDLSSIKVPVRWWHGDADPFVPLEQAQRAVVLFPDAEFVVRPGESHLGGFAAADEVLTVLSGIWHETVRRPTPGPQPTGVGPRGAAPP
jgi:pimeloyl-ACP methyl ester carboxylesterase